MDVEALGTGVRINVSEKLKNSEVFGGKISTFTQDPMSHLCIKAKPLGAI